MDRFVHNRLLQLINLEIQTAFQVSRPISPFQIILDKRVNDLDTLEPKEISSIYKLWCVFYHPDKQNDTLAEERREEATNVIKDVEIIIQNSEQVKQLSLLIS